MGTYAPRRASSIVKYQRWYQQIIERAESRSLTGYGEWHHVIPRSLGGGDDGANLVLLTYREHFLCHWLLTKIHFGAAKRKMVFALRAMTLDRDGRRIRSGWQFDVARRALRDVELNPDPEREAKFRLRHRELHAVMAQRRRQRFYNARNEREENRRFVHRALASAKPNDLTGLANLYLRHRGAPIACRPSAKRKRGSPGLNG